jgi:hypothetical protein
LRFLPVLRYEDSKMNELSSADLLDIVASGIGGSMLARKWEDKQLVNVDNETLERLLNNPELMAILEKIEGFSKLGENIETVISKEKDLNKLKREKDKADFTESEKKMVTKAEKEKKDFKKDLIEKLLKFVTRVPVFMYLTEKREATLIDVITQLEPALFKRVTGLRVEDFNQLCSLGVFHSQNMNSAIFAFKRFEESSLKYTGLDMTTLNVGLFDKSVNKNTTEFQS